MGLPRKSPEEMALVNKMVSLLNKAGYEIIFPKEMEKLCCGTIWESKGMMDIANRKSKELEDALWKASEKGKYPVLCDQSPCLHRMRETIQKMRLYEPAEFIYLFLRDRLEFTPIDEPIESSKLPNFAPRMFSCRKRLDVADLRVTAVSRIRK